MNIILKALGARSPINVCAVRDYGSIPVTGSSGPPCGRFRAYAQRLERSVGRGFLDGRPHGSWRPQILCARHGDNQSSRGESGMAVWAAAANPGRPISDLIFEMSDRSGAIQIMFAMDKMVVNS